MTLKTVTFFLGWLSIGAAFAIAASAPTTRPATARPAANGPDASPAAAVGSTTEPLRDPTLPGDALRQEFAGAQPAAAPAASPLPQITRRGLVVVKGVAEGLIEVQGAGIYFVSKGSVLTVVVNSVTLTLRVTALSADQLTIQVDSRKESINVR